MPEFIPPPQIPTGLAEQVVQLVEKAHSMSPALGAANILGGATMGAFQGLEQKRQREAAQATEQRGYQHQEMLQKARFEAEAKARIVDIPPGLRETAKTHLGFDPGDKVNEHVLTSLNAIIAHKMQRESIETEAGKVRAAKAEEAEKARTAKAEEAEKARTAKAEESEAKRKAEAEEKEKDRALKRELFKQKQIEKDKLTAGEKERQAGYKAALSMLESVRAQGKGVYAKSGLRAATTAPFRKAAEYFKTTDIGAFKGRVSNMGPLILRAMGDKSVRAQELLRGMEKDLVDTTHTQDTFNKAVDFYKQQLEAENAQLEKAHKEKLTDAEGAGDDAAKLKAILEKHGIGTMP